MALADHAAVDNQLAAGDIPLYQTAGHDLNLTLARVDIAAYGAVNIDVSLGDNVSVKADTAGDNRGGRFSGHDGWRFTVEYRCIHRRWRSFNDFVFFKHMVNPLILKMKNEGG